MHQTYTLNNGVKLPKIGLGTWQVPNGEDTYNSVRAALKNGYRHIDTAAGYGNEESVGRAIKESCVPRKDIFVTSKLESHVKTYDETMNAFEETMNALGFEYLDLYLIHAPWPWSEMGKNCDEGNVEAFKAMEKLYNDGRIRSIGVSNFSISDIKNILTHCDVTPAVNQIGYFIGLDNDELQAFCEDKGIQIVGYSPLAIGYALSNDTIQAMAKKYDVTPAQICIRYDLQKGVVPLPKSTHESRIIENSQVDFTIKEEDIEVLSNIKGDPRQFD
jgi:diketogulonate reductase-like aldo/keto reductase